MKFRALVATGILGLALSQTAAAIPMTEVVTFDENRAPGPGSATFSFDSTTAPVGSNCGTPLCGLDAFSATFAGESWDLSDVTSFSVLFQPATQIASWSISVLKVTVTDLGDTTFNGTLTGQTGGALGGEINKVIRPREIRIICDPSPTVPCEEPPPQPPRRAIFIPEGTWSAAAPVPVPGQDTSVPEPTSAALALLGLGVALRRRRQILA